MMEKNKAVIYARFSSNNQREESLDAQIRACEQYAKNNGYIIINKYCDSAKSGTTADREQFQKMIKDSEERNFDFVIVHKLDRFSRDKYDSVHYKTKLKERGVRVLSVLENLSDDPESIMLESVLEGMSQYYSANLAREVKKGLKENALKSEHTGGYPPLGFDVVNKKYLINEEEAEIVRVIFDMCSNYKGLTEIINHLNIMGYKTKFNKPFSKSSVHAILKNEKYKGVYVYNRKKERNFQNKRKPTKHNEEDIIRNIDGLPRIISDETYDKVQEILKVNKKLGCHKNAKINYLLSGLIKCGECHSSMCGNSRTGGQTTKMYSSYRCSCRQSKKIVDTTNEKCINKEIRKEYIENFVLDELNEILFVDDNINKLIQMMNKYENERQEKRKAELNRYDKQLKNIDNEIKNALSMVSEAIVSYDEISSVIVTLGDRKKAIKDKITELEGNTIDNTIKNNDLEKLIKESKKYLLSKDIPVCRNFMHAYIEGVYVYFDKIVVKFKINSYDENTDTFQNITREISRADLLKSSKHLLKQKAV